MRAKKSTNFWPKSKHSSCRQWLAHWKGPKIVALFRFKCADSSTCRAAHCAEIASFVQKLENHRKGSKIVWIHNALMHIVLNCKFWSKTKKSLKKDKKFFYSSGSSFVQKLENCRKVPKIGALLRFKCVNSSICGAAYFGELQFLFKKLLNSVSKS